MAKKRSTSREKVWVNSSVGRPPIEGNVEITKGRKNVRVAGDPEGLRSLARLLLWIADEDQESIHSQPVGERFHLHLYPKRPEFGVGFGSLTEASVEAELCRLDAKGTGDLWMARKRR